jgi:hypothetical protein
MFADKKEPPNVLPAGRLFYGPPAQGEHLKIHAGLIPEGAHGSMRKASSLSSL